MCLAFLFPAIDCDTEEILNLSQNKGIDTEFDKSLAYVVALYGVAVWNMNSSGGYWFYSNDIKTYLNIDSVGKLKVSVFSS